MNAHSEDLADIAAAICKAQAAFPNVEPDAMGQVGQGKYKYATLSHILKVVGPTLAENGLSVIQTCEPGEGMRVTTTLLHASGQYISGTIDLPVSQQTPQAAGSAITYARRYSLTAILGIAPDEDDDAQSVSQGRPRTAPRARTEPPAPAPRSHAVEGGYGHVTPARADNVARGWFFAKVKEECGIDSKTAYDLLEVKSLSEEMPDNSFEQILGFIKLAQQRQRRGIA